MELVPGSGPRLDRRPGTLIPTRLSTDLSRKTRMRRIVAGQAARRGARANKPGVDVLGTPGWLTPGPVPVVVVEAPPGAALMPAAAGLAGAPTGGLVPTPGAVPVWAAAPAPCANAGAPLPIMAIAMNVERCSFCRMEGLQC
jgi:hypothetical protein